MKITDWDTFALHGVDTEEPVSFTTGVFDGVHKGHLELINCLTTKTHNLTVVATFKKNPFSFLNPEKYIGDICSLECKIALLDSAGVDIVILIDFSPEFSKLTGREFFDYIRKHLNLSHLVLGEDHRLGYKGDTGSHDADLMLAPEGVTVDIVKPLYIDGKAVSSTRIRKAILKGKLNEAGNLLGRNHYIAFNQEDICSENNSLFMKRNKIKQVIPAVGEYAVTLSGGKKTFATKIIINKDSVLFEDLPDFRTELLTFNSQLQE